VSSRNVWDEFAKGALSTLLHQVCDVEISFELHADAQFGDVVAKPRLLHDPSGTVAEWHCGRVALWRDWAAWLKWLPESA
jgi:hypothetical protein